MNLDFSTADDYGEFQSQKHKSCKKKYQTYLAFRKANDFLYKLLL